MVQVECRVEGRRNGLMTDRRESPLNPTYVERVDGV